MTYAKQNTNTITLLLFFANINAGVMYLYVDTSN